MLGALIGLGFLSPQLNGIYYGVLVGIALLLAYQHRIVSASNLALVNRSFFTTNAIISFTLMVTFIVESGS